MASVPLLQKNTRGQTRERDRRAGRFRLERVEVQVRGVQQRRRPDPRSPPRDPDARDPVTRRRYPTRSRGIRGRRRHRDAGPCRARTPPADAGRSEARAGTLASGCRRMSIFIAPPVCSRQATPSRRPARRARVSLPPAITTSPTPCCSAARHACSFATMPLFAVPALTSCAASRVWSASRSSVPASSSTPDVPPAITSRLRANRGGEVRRERVGVHVEQLTASRVAPMQATIGT